MTAKKEHRTLTKDELAKAHTLLDEIRAKLNALANGDRLLLHAFRRKIFKELMYDERDKPAKRKQLKQLLHAKQKGLCTHCHMDLPLTRSELDRTFAPDGYTEVNVELVHAACHHERQEAKGYT